MRAFQVGIALAVNRGGLDKPILALVNPRTFAGLVQNKAALRQYDAKYSPASAENGFEMIRFYAANGVNMIQPDPCV